jgi:sortase (surface protein transpeptidase)
MEIPDETEIGWYRYGATAGQPGATVLAAHVNWNRVPGPFARLGRVEPGDQIEVALDDGTLRRYEVVERAVYGKLELPRERLWRNTGPEELVLITCGGDYNPEIRRVPREHRRLRGADRLRRSALRRGSHACSAGNRRAQSASTQ